MTEEQWRARFDARLGTVEDRLNHIEKQDAVAEVHRANVETRLSSIEGTLQKLVWLIIGSLLAYVLNQILAGNLNVVP